MRTVSIRWFLVVLGLAALAPAALADVAAPVDGAFVCAGLTGVGCCENGTAVFCGTAGTAELVSCRGNRVYSECGLHDGYADCMEEGAAPAPRCSLPPAPPEGEDALPDPGALAGTCPDFPTLLTLDTEAPATCPGAPATLALVQAGCAFVMGAPSEGATTTVVGQVDGRVVQLSYLVDREPVTCLAAIAADDGSVSGVCDGPWGFGATACKWTYRGDFSWPSTPDPAADAGGDDVQRPEDGGGGGGGCAAAAIPGLAGLLPLLLGAFALLGRRLRRR